MGDKRRPRMKWGGVLLSSIFLARRLRATWEGQEMVGILLPPSVPGALVNFAAMLSGKIPVNLNYTIVGRSAGLLRRAVQARNGDHHKAACSSESR